MYFKISMRHNPAKGKIDGYYRLVESYRNTADRVCHRTLLNVGFLDDVATVEQLNQIQGRLTQKYAGAVQGNIFEDPMDADPLVNQMSGELWVRLVKEKRIDLVEYRARSARGSSGDWETIDMNSLRHKDVREIGSEWICYQALEQLHLSDFLSNQGWEELEVRLALTHLISRTVYPASELETSRWIKENSAVCEITGYPVENITKDRLYHISLCLYRLKDKLEEYLCVKTNELFDIEDKIILYDLTNTYFEGQMRKSEIARFGRSKEKRTDAKLIVLGLVVNPEGFIKYSSLLEGNVSDASTLEGMINKLRLHTTRTAAKAIVVMDAGIATDSNLKILKEKGYDYLCVTRSNMKNYTLAEPATQVEVRDKKNQKIVLQKVSSSKNNDYYLKVESEGKKQKERSMNNRFQAGFEAGLVKISTSLDKKSGIKKEDKVLERVGRLKQKYPSIHRYYEITYKIETEEIKKRKKAESEQRRIVKSLTWKQREDVDINQRSGIYFLRTSIENTEKILWEGYNTIREVEATIRVLKSIDIRPVYHKKDETSMAHLHLGLMAYWIVNTIRYQLKKKESNTEKDDSIHFQWKEIVRIMNTQKAVTTVAQNKVDQLIMIRKCSDPSPNVKAIYDKLKYKQVPFKKKKFVVHKTELKKPNFADMQDLRSG
jgi:transposase